MAPPTGICLTAMCRARAGTGAGGVRTVTTDTLADGTYSFTAAAMDSVGQGQRGIDANRCIGRHRSRVIIDGHRGTVGHSRRWRRCRDRWCERTIGDLCRHNRHAQVDQSLDFTGQVSGLAGSDGLDLVDVSYGANTTATFLGNANGGTLTVSDGTHTANIALQGNYLSSSWTVSSDGNGGTLVVDPVASNNWQTLDVGAGGWLTGIDVAPDGTMVVRTDTYGAYIWNGTAWQQLVTSTSMPASL